MSEPTTIKQQLVELLNAALAEAGNPTVYVEADLTFGTPEAYEEGTVDTSEIDSYNTSILVTAGEGLEQVQYRLHYTRLDLSTLTRLRDAELVTEITTESSTHDVLAPVGEHLGVSFDAEDLDDVLFEAIDGESNLVTLRAAVGSLGFTGEATLVVSDLPPV